MTSRERIQAVINRKIPDRIPTDIGGTLLTGIHVDMYLELARHLGFDCELPKVYDQYQLLTRVEGHMRNFLHSDVIPLENPATSFGYRNENWKSWKTQNNNEVLVPGSFDTYLDEDGVICLRDNTGALVAKMPQGGLYFDKMLTEVDLMAEIEFTPAEEFRKSIPLYTDDELRVLEKNAKALHDYTDYAVAGEFIKCNLGTSGDFARHPFTQWMMVTALEPEYAYEMLSVYAEQAIVNLKLYLEAVGDNIDIIVMSTSDFGTQKNAFYNPETFAELYEPNYKKVTDHLHANSKAKAFFHSCGSVHTLYDSFVKMGVDIVNPIQVAADGMDPVMIKEKYGKDMILWGGGIDTQYVLPQGTPEEVDAQVKKHIEIFGKDGGFVFTAVHNIQHGIPPENLVAMVNAVEKYGKY